MTPTERARHIREAVRRGNRVLRLRRGLRQLDDRELCKRLAKYLGKTPGEVKFEYRHVYASGLDRDRVIASILRIEDPE